MDPILRSSLYRQGIGPVLSFKKILKLILFVRISSGFHSIRFIDPSNSSLCNYIFALIHFDFLIIGEILEFNLSDLVNASCQWLHLDVLSIQLIQFKISSTYMGYINFNPRSINRGIQVSCICWKFGIQKRDPKYQDLAIFNCSYEFWIFKTDQS